jgi:hypothetical protein
MGSSENLEAISFIDNSIPIVAQQVVHVHRKFHRGFPV